MGGAPGGRGAFPKVIVIALIALGIFLYVPFTSKAFRPSDIITSAANTRYSTTIQDPHSLPQQTKNKYSSKSSAVTVQQKFIDSEELKSRCWGTKGSWCRTWLTNLNDPIPATSPPRYNKFCLWDCNGVGVCDYSTGWCRCPAGWDGDACDVRMRRPCSQKHRSFGFEPYEAPAIDWKDPYVATLRCNGQCDEDIGMCFCNSTSRYGRIPANLTDPPKTPPYQFGRQLGHDCQPNFNPSGEDSDFANRDPEDIYGVDGWCEADTKPKIYCECFLDGLLGDLCDVPVEHFCANQCSGHGECYLGWCQCHKGYYGHDCAYRLPGVDWDDGLIDGLVSFGEAVQPRYWLADVARTPAAKDIPQDVENGALDVEEDQSTSIAINRTSSTTSKTDVTSRIKNLFSTPKTTTTTSQPTRHRPLIYVYELPTKYNQLMLQYRFERYSCTHRLFDHGNVTTFLDSWNYQLETALHEMLLQSKHRTLDPEEADFFYMPVYVSCFYWPVFGAADFPWFHGGPTSSRVSQGTNLLLDLWTWVQSHRPYWDRYGGRDHILLVTHDEGSCHVPAVLRNATILTHWGRKDAGHTSGSAYDADVYSDEVIHPVYQPEGHLKKLGNFPCYDPVKDLVIPPMFSPLKYYYSPLHGAPEHRNNRSSMLAFFKGDLRIQDNRMIYSRGIRQNLTSLRMEHKWWSKYKIWIGSTMPPVPYYKELTYGEALSSSIFCFVLPGDGWSGRFEDAIMHGCIPVIIQDDVDVSFESLFDMKAFSLRIDQKEMKDIPEILQSISAEEVEKLQQGVKKVMGRFWYGGTFGPHAALSKLIREDWEAEQAKGNGSAEDAATNSQKGTFTFTDVSSEYSSENSEKLSNKEESNEKEEEGEEKNKDQKEDKKDKIEQQQQQQQQKRRQRRLLATTNQKMHLMYKRMDKRMIEHSSALKGDKLKRSVEATTEGIQDDAFDTILAFLLEKMKRWEQDGGHLGGSVE